MAEVPSGPVTVTSTTLVPPGATTVSRVSLKRITVLPGLPPKLTSVTPVKPLPVTVTTVPPAGGPLTGETPVTTGGEAARTGCCSTDENSSTPRSTSERRVVIHTHFI